MSRTTLIISDTHLGRPGRVTAEALRPLWQGIDQLVINGDAAEVQIPSLRTASLRELEQLTEMTRQDDVELSLISGNHDAYLTDTRYLQLLDKRVLVMHGDALHPAVAPWTRCAKVMHRLTDKALAEAEPSKRSCLHTRLSIAQHVGHSEFLEEYVLSNRGEGGLWHALRRPWEVPQVLRYWRQEPGLAVSFIEQYAPATEVLIVGHSHRPGVWQRSGRTVINTGAFSFPGKPWCVLLDGDGLQVARLEKTKSGYQRARPPVVSMAMHGARQPKDARPDPGTQATDAA